MAQNNILLPVALRAAKEKELAQSKDVTPAKAACAKLAALMPSQVFLGKSGNFDFWDAKQHEVTPVCRIEPETARDVATILQVANEFQCCLAVKSGGHCMIAGSSNAKDGLTIDLVRMSDVKIASDRKTVTVGPGARWVDVLVHVQAEDMLVVGGRIADVGVGGLVLGGGISWLSGRYGWACDNVVSYEVVLPNAKIITADLDNYPDLYWALRGAGSFNFGIVTSFELETKPMPDPEGFYNGIKMYSWDKIPQILPLHYEYMSKGADQDFDSSVFNSFAYSAAYDTFVARTQHVQTTHTSHTTAPKVFQAYQHIECIAQSEQTTCQLYSSIAEDLCAAGIHGARNTYATFTHKPSLELDHRMLELYTQTVTKNKHIEDFLPILCSQQLPKSTLRMMSKNGGNCLGLDDRNGPLVNVLVTWRWSKATDDALCFQTVKVFVDLLEVIAKELGVYHPFKYINYAGKWQTIFESYGMENFTKLKQIQRKYDPEEVFTDGGLASGYFKLNKKGEKVDLETSSCALRDGRV